MIKYVFLMALLCSCKKDPVRQSNRTAKELCGKFNKIITSYFEIEGRTDSSIYINDSLFIIGRSSLTFNCSESSFFYSGIEKDSLCLKNKKDFIPIYDFINFDNKKCKNYKLDIKDGYIYISSKDKFFRVKNVDFYNSINEFDINNDGEKELFLFQYSPNQWDGLNVQCTVFQ